jgi:hypothetical protein
MEHLSVSADRHAPRATGSLNNASDINRSLYRSQSVDARAPRATESPRSEPNDLNFLYLSRSSDQLDSRPTQSEHERERPTASQGQPFDSSSIYDGSQQLRQPVDDALQQDIVRSLYQSRSSDGLASRFVQPERRPVRKSRSLDKIDPNTTAERRHSCLGTPPSIKMVILERRQTNPPLSHWRSFDGTFPLEASRQSPDSRSSLNISRLPRSTEIWTPSSARIGDTIQSPGNSASSFRGYPYERSQPIYRDRVSDLRRPDDIEEITPVVPSTSYRLETLSRDSMGERGSNQTNGQDVDALLRALDITEHSTLGIAMIKEYAQIIMDVVKTRGNEQELLWRLSEKSTQISRERDQANNRDVETLLRALGIRDDNLGSGNYLEAWKHAQTIVRVIRTDGQDKEFNDASEALLKLAPKRSWLRSLVNPRKDTIDWYNASWRNQHAMSKLDTTTWGGSIRKLFYQANQPIAGLTNTRLGNLGFIGLQAVLGTAYTSYIEKAFASSTLESCIEYAATARFFYSKLPNPLNQLIDTIQFQGVSIGLYQAQASHA